MTNPTPKNREVQRLAKTVLLDRKAAELPESVQIAQLLAELMPEASASSPLPEEILSTDFTQAELPAETREAAFDEPSPPAVRAQTGPATFVERAAPVANKAPVAPPPLPPIPRREIPAAVIKEPEAAKIEQPPSAAPPAKKPVKAEEPPTPAAATAAGERIPLGDLTVAGFFSLVNWRNDPAAVRHPPFAPRYDARTTAELRKIPFLVLDAPPSEDAWSVAAVLKSFTW